ncbi:flagellar basal body-associated protein FliL [Thalassobacillus pellis]|uniref:flagellar basal body-associated protein FliL n=1 Tax=Thalassobacillus pellis TaxID=748008 RepID=UPI0019620D19|nr:flagellar basal body-associated protein FliL [Thalassobacillus pellis]MBM7552742.1 flagellar FliL protein [Thalassobacillus pellis]
MTPKLIKTMVISFISLCVLGAAAVIFVLNIGGKEKASGKRSIDEILEASFRTEEITTDLKDDHFVRVQFHIVSDSVEANEELQKRDFQLKNVLIKELAQMDAEMFKQDLSKLEAAIKEKLNETMTEGKITKVYTTSKILQ